jgi:hypothetical protein
MPGDILKKRKIAVLGSRSVGEPDLLADINGHTYPIIRLDRKVVPRHTVHGESVYRVLLPYYRKHIHQERQL